MTDREKRKQIKQGLDAEILEKGIINVIRALHVERMFMMEQRKRCELALGAYLRTQEGWRKGKPEKERKEISARVQLMLDDGVPEDSRYYPIIKTSRAGSAAFIEQEDLLTWKLEYVAEKLPVWSAWGKDVRGLGVRSLGVIVGEAGDLSNYDDHSKLWKRMGVAVMDGVRQGNLPKTAHRDEWEAHGYSPKRRSHMYTIGDCLVKNGTIYRQIYLTRKEYERQSATEAGMIIVPAAKIPKNDKDAYVSDGHIHKRAQRYMEKKLLRDLWKAWRRAGIALPERAIGIVPSALSIAA